MRTPNFLILLVGIFVASAANAGTQSTPENDKHQRSRVDDSGWIDLFNGKDLEGWYTFLEKHGKNNDPQRVFKVEHGMIHILGVAASEGVDAFGYLATVHEIAHCRIRAEFKWGEARFAPVAEDKRDSGLIYYTVGPDAIWPRSLQLQIAETDVGDLWINGGIRVITSISTENPPTYDDGFSLHHTDRGRIVKSGDFEDRTGWNTVELILDNDRVTHIVNGRAVMRAWDLRQPDPKDPSRVIPLTSGRLLLEAEGAEVWFRKIQMKPITPHAVPTNLYTVSDRPLSLDSTFGQLLLNSHSHSILEALISPDALHNPTIDSFFNEPARAVLPALTTMTDEQMQALDRTLHELPPGR